MEDPLGAQRTMTLPQQITDQCAALNIPFTGVSSFHSFVDCKVETDEIALGQTERRWKDVNY